MKTPIDYLIVPGWHGSGADHWQSHWQNIMPYSRRMAVSNWQEPDLDEWTSALQQQIEQSDSSRIVLVAHSLGCTTVAHWAKRYGQRHAHRVHGALLVAPADVERPLAPEALQSFAPIPRSPLPFPSLVIGSSNDKAASAERAQAFANWWGSDVEILTGVGHINTVSGHHRWVEGLGFLARLAQQAKWQRKSVG